MLAIKRFFAKRRLERAYEILDFYDNHKEIFGILEKSYLIVAKSQVGWLLKHWKKYGMID